VFDRIVVAIQNVLPNRKVKSGDVSQSLVVRLKKEKKRKDGTTINFFENSAILLNQKGIPQGTRIFGPVPRELRKKKIHESCIYCTRSNLKLWLY
jgi:large subunit ribosomal protein L14